MSDTPKNYPLTWPSHKPRRRRADRLRGDFSADGKRITLDAATDRLEAEIQRLGGVYPLLSSNVELRMDGRPRADRSPPADGGVCVYFQIKGTPYAMASDTYREASQNIAAIAETIKASRMIERYGVVAAAETLQAFAALPPPAPGGRAIEQGAPPRPWHEVLGIMPSAADKETILALYRAKLKRAHPDTGGSDLLMHELSRAKDEGLKAVGA